DVCSSDLVEGGLHGVVHEPRGSSLPLVEPASSHLLHRDGHGAERPAVELTDGGVEGPHGRKVIPCYGRTPPRYAHRTMSSRQLTPTDNTNGPDRAIHEARAGRDDLTAPKEQRTFDNTMRPIDRIGDIMGHAFFRYAFMGYVHTDKDVRTAAKEAEEKL